MGNRYVIATLSDLLQVISEGARGFTVCAAHARDGALRDEFSASAARYAASSAELRGLLRRLGWDPVTKGGGQLRLRRTWDDLRTILALNSDEALVELCGRGGDHALEVYRNALDDLLPEFVWSVVLRQFVSAMSAHPQIRIPADSLSEGGISVASDGERTRL